MHKFKTAIVGGTFDILHKGHFALLDAAFEAADEILVGLTSDEFAASRGKKTQSYETRHTALQKYIESNYAARKYEIHKLDSAYGLIASDKRVEALIVSSETQPNAAQLNEKRTSLGVNPVEVIVVPMILADNGSKISSTRIRLGELDSNGHVL